MPFIFQAQWGVNPNFLLIIFGVGLLQVLLTAPGGIVAADAEGHGEPGAPAGTRLYRKLARRAGSRMIEVEGLTVRFAGVTPIDDVSVVFPGGTCGLIGPNGAGKTTFFNVLSGFVKPAGGIDPRVRRDLLKMVDYRRARWGLRRTFQTEMAIEQLSVFDNVAMIHEHSGAEARVAPGRRPRRDRVRRPRGRRRTRRSAGSARASGASSRSPAPSSASPRVVLLDEPAAGLPDEETEHLGERDPEDPRAVRRARDPRRPRHEPRLRPAARRPPCSTSAS